MDFGITSDSTFITQLFVGEGQIVTLDEDLMGYSSADVPSRL